MEERATQRIAEIHFDQFTLDLRRGCLRQGDREIQLRPKSFEVLRYLVQNADRLIWKEEVMAIVWPGVTVTDESLARCISDIRVALDDRGPRLIRTVPRRGYRLAVPTVAGEVDDLPEHAPTPTGSAESRTQLNGLPRLAHTLIGRDRDVAEIEALLSRHRLVTLVGTAGVGKTSLSLRVGAELFQASRQRAEELHDLRSSEPSSQHNHPLSIDAVNLENLLRQVETDRGNLHVGRLLPSVGDNTHHSGTQMPLRGRPHHPGNPRSFPHMRGEPPQALSGHAVLLSSVRPSRRSPLAFSARMTSQPAAFSAAR